MKLRDLGPAFVALMFAAFIESMGSFLVLALLPFYGLEFGASATTIGWLVAAFALAQLVSAPLWGRLSDGVGRKRVLLIGLAVTALAYWMFARADSLTALFASRLLQGLGAGTVSVVFAYLGDILPADRRAEGIGWVTAATSGAAMVGPALGSIVAGFDPSYPGYWSFGLSLLAIGLVLWLLPETERKSQRDLSEAPADSERSLRRALVKVVAQPLSAGPRLILTYAVGMLATSATFGVIGLYLGARFGIDESSIWWFFSLLAGTSLVFRVWAIGPLVRRYSEERLIIVGGLGLGIATVAMALPTSTAWLVAPIVLFALGQSVLYPCTTSRLSQVAQGEGAGLLGQAMGVQQAYGGVSRVIGPIAAGWAFAELGPRVPFFACGALVLIWVAVLASRVD